MKHSKVQDQFRKFTEEGLSLKPMNGIRDDLIPDQTLEKMAELGVFSIAILKTMEDSVWVRLQCVLSLKNFQGVF